MMPVFNSYVQSFYLQPTVLKTLGGQSGTCGPSVFPLPYLRGPFFPSGIFVPHRPFI